MKTFKWSPLQSWQVARPPGRCRQLLPPPEEQNQGWLQGHHGWQVQGVGGVLRARDKWWELLRLPLCQREWGRDWLQRLETSGHWRTEMGRWSRRWPPMQWGSGWCKTTNSLPPRRGGWRCCNKKLNINCNIPWIIKTYPVWMSSPNCSNTSTGASGTITQLSRPRLQKREQAKNLKKGMPRPPLPMNHIVSFSTVGPRSR